MRSPLPLQESAVYIIFLISLMAGIAILAGRRSTGIALSLISIMTLAGLLVHHMTDKLPISL
jgi:uncharacterized membrane protein YphA (DoxX/SURF4 family)